MKFNDAATDQALLSWRSSSDVLERCCADNIHFEERVSDKRRAFFENQFGAVGDVDQLRLALETYANTYVTVDEEPPHTFVKALDPADLGDLEDSQIIVRYEKITRPLNDFGITFDDLKVALEADDLSTIDAFMDVWNTGGSRDWRPMFGAFRDELSTEMPPADWPVLIRDRLGLAHHNCAHGSVPVALLAYTVGEVKKAAAAFPQACAFASPTALDQGPWPYFFPAPPQITCGRAMSLKEVRDETYLLSEVLHFRIPYRRKHLLALEELVSPPPHFDLAGLRNHHLLAVRIASGRDDFGEEIP